MAKAQGVDAVLQKREQARRNKAEWFAQPLGRKVTDVLALTLLVVGFVLGRFAGPIEYNALGAVLVAVSLGLLWLVHRRRPEHT